MMNSLLCMPSQKNSKVFVMIVVGWIFFGDCQVRCLTSFSRRRLGGARLKKFLFHRLGATFTGVVVAVIKELDYVLPSLSMIKLHVSNCMPILVRCVLFVYFTLRNLKLCAIAVYMPTTWHSDDDVEEVYGLLDVLLDDCAHNSVYWAEILMHV